MVKNKASGSTFVFNDNVFVDNRRLAVPVTHYENDMMLFRFPDIIKKEINFDVSPDINFNYNGSSESCFMDVVEDNRKKSQSLYTKLIQDAMDELKMIDFNRRERLRILEEKRKEQLRREEEKKLKEQQQHVADLREAQGQLNKEATTASGIVGISGGTPSGKDGSSMDTSSNYLPAASLTTSNDRGQGERVKAPFVPKNRYTDMYINYLNEYKGYKSEYDAFVSIITQDIKSIRISIAKKINTCINTVAGTIKQVENTHNTINNLLCTYNDNRIKIFIIFRIIEGILNCCESGNQIYINPKSVWPFAHLIRGLCILDKRSLIIYSVMAAKRSCFIIPRLYISNDEEQLKKLHKFNTIETTYCKFTQSVIKLHLAFLVVTNNINSIWSWFAGFINSCWNNVFKLPLSCILVTAFETAGFIALKTYNQQFIKVSTLYLKYNQSSFHSTSRGGLF